jgi:arabinogalactan oligomer/maltooligosaccharide transport system substrate-binding protein
MYYNKAYFSEEDVETLDSMLSVAAANGKKVVLDMSSGWYLYTFFGLTGLEVGLNDDGITNYCTWNATDGDITGIDVAEAMLAMAQSSGFASMSDDDFIAGVQDGSVIAGVSGVWDATSVEAAWGSDYGAVKLPTYTCAGQQVQMASFAGYKMVGVNAYSSNTEWAHKLAEWITNEENQTLRFNERGQGPANAAAASTPEVAAAPAIQALLAQSEYSSLQRIGGNYWTPTSEFGVSMSEGNPSGKDLQLELDNMVEAITATYGN